MRKRSAHSHLTRMLREAQAAAREARTAGAPIGEVTELRRERTRREFLAGAGSVLAATALTALFPRRAWAASQPRIVIVGAGLAGLRCAHALWTEAGLASTIYEWDDHAGGRVQTLRDFFLNGQIVEQHGEFISSEHHSMRRLAHRFGLKLENAEQAPSNVDDAYWFNGAYYTQSQLNHDWHHFGWRLFNRAVRRAPFPTLYNQHGHLATKWDHMSVVEWIDAFVPGGLDSPFGGLCYQDVLGEYGGPPERQSALNLLYILGYDDSLNTANNYQPRSSPVLSGTDELYHVRGGNDQIIAGMVNELPGGSVLTGQKLVAARKNADGSFACTFEDGSSTYDVTADHVVFAIPFNKLKDVDLSGCELSARKLRAIRNLALGTNGKLQIQFDERVWVRDGYSGTFYADNNAASGWECTNYQRGKTGILIDFPAGAEALALPAKYGLTQDEQVAPPAMVADFLAALEPIMPGVTAAYNGLAYSAVGILDPHLGGAWSQYQVGQYTDFGGYEGVREGNLHFAGEHTSIDFQGFMEGAVTSGERVAQEIAGAGVENV